MEFWTEVRRQVLVEGLSKRAAVKQFDISWHTLEKILTHAEPPGYRQQQPRRRDLSRRARWHRAATLEHGINFRRPERLTLREGIGLYTSIEVVKDNQCAQ
jgi:hypothetical protein